MRWFKSKYWYLVRFISVLYSGTDVKSLGKTQSLEIKNGFSIIWIVSVTKNACNVHNEIDQIFLYS